MGSCRNMLSYLHTLALSQPLFTILFMEMSTADTVSQCQRLLHPAALLSRLCHTVAPCFSWNCGLHVSLEKIVINSIHGIYWNNFG